MVGPKNAAYAEESAEVEVLNANLAKLKTLTKRIQASMTRLDVSGQVVQEAIGPIYSNTQQLQVTTRNIDRVNEAIERLRQPLDAKGREEGIIRAGPQASGLPQYLGAIKRVDKALSELTSSNLRSNQQAISDFDNLLMTGVTQLQEVFKETLREDVTPVEPLHYITKGLTFPTVPPEKIQQLGQIASAISSTAAQSARYGMKDDDAAGRAYAEIRGQYMAKSLENLSRAAISTSKRRTQDATSIYREGSSGVGTYATGIEGMCLSEHENIEKIFRGQAVGRILTQTCQPTLTNFGNTLRELNGVIKARIWQDCFLSYEILDLVTPLSYRLESKTGQLRPQFSDALRPIRESARTSLTELLVQTKARVEKTATLDSQAASPPIVSDTCTRLHALATFDRPLNSLLSSVGEGNWRTTAGANSASNTSLPLSLTPSSENPTLTSHYMLDLIETLLTALEVRSRPPAFNDKSELQGIFLLNGIALIQRAITASPDLSRYLAISPHNEKLAAWRKKASKIYLEAWQTASRELLDTIHTSKPTPTASKDAAGRPLSGQAIDSTQIVKSLNSKQKDVIKAKFNNFNSSLEKLSTGNKAAHMEKEVRSALAREIQQTIEPLYARFWDRYHEVDKGKGKVVKHDKGAVVSILVSLG